MSSFRAPQQHKQPSRKGKKAWRKNVDITEIQTGLETLREDIIQGGPLGEKPSEDIFALDTTGSEVIIKKYQLRKPLKTDEILAKRSVVEAVDSRKRAGAVLTEGTILKRRQRTGWVSKKEVQRLKAVAKTGPIDDLDEYNLLTDLWAEEKIPKDVHNHLEYVPRPMSKVAPHTLHRPPIALTASGIPIQAVKQPETEASYNPSFEAWDDLLTKEGHKAMISEKSRLEEEALDAERAQRIAASAREAGEGSDYGSAWEGFETEPEHDGASLLKQKRPERKTPKERNKIKRRKDAERQEKHEGKMANRQKQASQIEDDAKYVSTNSVVKTRTDVEVLGFSSSTATNEEKLRRRRLGNTTVPEKQLELVLPDELQDSLRRLKPEGNLLQDRFRNMLVNGKIEARKPILQHKKKRVKMTEKWAFKDFSIEV